MTQRNNVPNRLHNSWQRTLPAQSICWLSSFSLLSSGLALAQTESAIDNIVPTAESSQPVVKIPVIKDTLKPSHTNIVVEKSDLQPEFSQRRTRLKKRLQFPEISQPPQPVGIKKSEPQKVRLSKPNNTPITITQEKPQPAVSPSQVTFTAEKPQVEFNAPIPSRSTQQNISEVAQPPHHSPSSAKTTTGQSQDYNNAYIDPTDYNPTAKYEAPSSVVITERASGCQAVLAQGVASNNCGGNQSVANRKNGTPNWLKKSQNVPIAAIPVTKRLATSRKTNTGWRPPGIVSKVIPSNSFRSSRVANMGVNKGSYHPNRFIPSPSNFSPTTTVSSVPIAPSAGTLPAPMTADNLAPRPSVVAYDIPLAKTLPQIAYSAIYGGKVAIGGTGLVYPLAIPAPITSLFGWRIHPISGDRRFHAGMDLAAAKGTPILAAYSGQVEVADWVGGYGNAVILNHKNAQQTLYGHMSQIFVQPGQWVERGTVIGLVGSTGNSTGPHLHFEVRQLTPEGWVAVDPGVQIQSALGQLMQSLQTAQVQGSESRN